MLNENFPFNYFSLFIKIHYHASPIGFFSAITMQLEIIFILCYTNILLHTQKRVKNQTERSIFNNSLL